MGGLGLGHTISFKGLGQGLLEKRGVSITQHATLLKGGNYHKLGGAPRRPARRLAAAARGLQPA
eukprot:7633557-Pyramimonas_sp.AAC.1